MMTCWTWSRRTRRALQRALDGDGAEPRGGKRGERAEERADRRARAAEDDDVFHEISLVVVLSRQLHSTQLHSCRAARLYSFAAVAAVHAMIRGSGRHLALAPAPTTHSGVFECPSLPSPIAGSTSSRRKSTTSSRATCWPTATTSSWTCASPRARGSSTPAAAATSSTSSPTSPRCPIGYNHPKIDTPEFRDRIADAAINKPANSDIYTTLHGRVRRDLRPPGRAAVPQQAHVLHRGRRPRHRERHQDRLRLEDPQELREGLQSEEGHADHASARVLPRPQRLHALADQHRPAQDAVLPEVRLAAHRQPEARLPAHRRVPGRRRAPRAGRARAGQAVPRTSARTTSRPSSWSRSRAKAATTTSAPSSSAPSASSATRTTCC